MFDRTQGYDSWTWDEDKTTCKVSIGGEIDFLGSSKVRELFKKFIRETQGDVALYLDQLEYLDSSGLAVFIEARRILQEQGRNIQVLAIQRQVLKIFKLTHIDELFGII
jgi:anti-sigma B factor antagonist